MTWADWSYLFGMLAITAFSLGCIFYVVNLPTYDCSAGRHKWGKWKLLITVQIRKCKKCGWSEYGKI